jgi:hypothetical protein
VIGTSKPIEGTDDDPLYQTQRFGQSFAYRFDVPDGKYLLRLHFAETVMTVGLEMFDVLIQGEQALKGMCIFAEAGGMNRAVVRELVVDVAGNRLIIEFEGIMEPQQEAAKIAAIEVLTFEE